MSVIEFIPRRCLVLHCVFVVAVGCAFACSERPSARGEDFGLRLKLSAVGHSADSSILEVVDECLEFLVLDVLLPDFIGHIATRGNPISPSTQVLAPIALP